MARERDKGDSFDPRTWGGPGGAAAPSTSANGKPVSALRPVGLRVVPSRPAADRMGGSIPLWAALGVSVLILASGVLIARLRPSTPPTHRADAQALVAQAASAAPAERTLTVDSSADIATSLAQEGVVPEVAQGAGQEAASVLGSKVGEIRLLVSLAGPDGARELSRLEATRGDGSGVILTARPDGSYISEPKQPSGR